MSVLHIFLFLSLLYHHGLLVSSQTTIILTKLGLVMGRQEALVDYLGKTSTVNKFLGIPYAQKPIRFKPPQPDLTKRRQKMYNATYYRPVCLQYVKGNPYIASIKLAWPEFNHSKDMDEDCLFLNIYVPRFPSYPNSINCLPRKYPVMVYIHGGNYVAGTPIRDISPGEYLPRHDVVLVTIQYRLGAFGFFTTGDSEAQGNLGLLDQIEGLKWIQNNIDDFYGDKNSVTLLGEGTGGSSVSLLYLSPLSQGLFHRGIAVSGVALTPFAIKPNTTVLKASKTLAKNLGCEKKNSKLTVRCLQSKSRNDIIKINTDRNKLQPFVDNHFLRDEPRQLLKEGKFQRLPLMSGFVSDEGTNGISEPNIAKIPADYENYLDKLLFQKYLNFTKEQAPIAFNALAFQYTPWHDMERSEAYRKNVIDVLSDYTVIAPTHAVLSFHSDHGAKTYMFEFAHRSLKKTKNAWAGVERGDATAYKFGLPLLRSAKTNLKFDDDDRSVSKMMVTLFTNFAKSGSPGNNAAPGKAVMWTAFNTSNEAYLKIQRTPAMTSNYHSLRMGFWNSYFPKIFPCMGRTNISMFGRCKKSEAPRPIQSLNRESNPAEDPNLEIELW